MSSSQNGSKWLKFVILNSNFEIVTHRHNNFLPEITFFGWYSNRKMEKWIETSLQILYFSIGRQPTDTQEGKRVAEQQKEIKWISGKRKRGSGTFVCSWVTLAGAHLFWVRATGTFVILLSEDVTEDWRRKGSSGLCQWIAGSVSAKEKGMWGQSSVASTAGEVAGSGAILMWMHIATRFEDNCRTVRKKGKSS